MAIYECENRRIYHDVEPEKRQIGKQKKAIEITHSNAFKRKAEEEMK